MLYVVSRARHAVCERMQRQKRSARQNGEQEGAARSSGSCLPACRARLALVAIMSCVHMANPASCSASRGADAAAVFHWPRAQVPRAAQVARLRGGGDSGGKQEHQGAGAAGGPSKRALKRAAKRAAFADWKAAKKQQAKDERRAERVRRELAEADLSDGEANAISSAEHAAYLARVRERKSFAAQRALALEARGGRLQRVAIDLSFSGLMTDNEARSLASQLAASHGTNTKAVVPLDLQIVGVNASTTEGMALAKFDSHRWASSRAHGAKVVSTAMEACYSREDIVYLSADANETLSDLDVDKVYVIGGLVDRNRHKGASLARAQALGLASARLPVSENMAGCGHGVLTVNHLVHLLQLRCSNLTWARALEAVIPARKHAAASDHGISAERRAASSATMATSLPELNFVADEADHAETPLRAYEDLAPVLRVLAAALNKSVADLRIYDPYYCNGTVKRHLGSLGFVNVSNTNTDFYAAARSGTVPTHDVVVTNPPYSGDHIARLFAWLTSKHRKAAGGVPWMVLAPNYVYMKPFFQPILTGSALAILAPDSRYVYDNVGQARACLRTAPFASLWYIDAGHVMTSRALVDTLHGAPAPLNPLRPGTTLCRGTRRLPVYFHPAPIPSLVSLGPACTAGVGVPGADMRWLCCGLVCPDLRRGSWILHLCPRLAHVDVPGQGSRCL